MKKHSSRLNLIKALALAVIALAYPSPAHADEGTWVCGDCQIWVYDCLYVEDGLGCDSYGANCGRTCWYCSGGGGCYPA